MKTGFFFAGSLEEILALLAMAAFSPDPVKPVAPEKRVIDSLGFLLLLEALEVASYSRINLAAVSRLPHSADMIAQLERAGASVEISMDGPDGFASEVVLSCGNCSNPACEGNQIAKAEFRADGAHVFGMGHHAPLLLARLLYEQSLKQRTKRIN